MINPIDGTDKLKQGSLAKIMSYYMLDSEADQKVFLDSAEKNRGTKAAELSEYKNFFGCTPAQDFVEFLEAYEGYEKFSRSISDVWALTDGIDCVAQLNNEHGYSDLFHDWAFMITLLTGLERFGSDPCGDSCFFDTLSNPFQTTEVISFDHETGKLGDYTAYSLADFFSDVWGQCYDEGRRDELSKNDETTKEIIDSFNILARETRAKRLKHTSPRELFSRSHWVMGHLSGKPTYKYANKMADAPVYAEWEDELSFLSDNPVVANYWLLAHFFLNNKSALQETIKTAQKSTSKLTRHLAQSIENFERNPSQEKIGELTESDIVKLRLETRKNCLPEMLGPEQQEALAIERGEADVKRIIPQAFKKRIEAGDDPMVIIREFPDDVATHDRALSEIAKRDEIFAKIVEQYFEERGNDAYNNWPYGDTPLDQRLSIPVSAAFRSGLKFDEDHQKAFAGITQTLSKFDDDHAYAAYREAIEKLNPNDDRIEYVIENLSISDNSQKEELLVLAANQVFHILERIKNNEEQQKKEREEEGYHLDNMFDVENHFLEAIRLVLKSDNDQSIILAGKILQLKEERKLFKRNLGNAFRIAGNNNLQEYSEYISWFINAVDGIKSKQDSSLGKINHYNFTEAVIAYTRLNPEDAQPLLKKMFSKKTFSRRFDFDLKSGILPGLMILNPGDEELHNWVRRLLGNRSNHYSIKGALRAVAETEMKEAEEWVRYHLYSDCNSFMPDHYVIKDLAREAIEALGIDAPKFDDDDEYATALAGEGEERLVAGFTHPEKYWPKHICKKIRDNNITGEKVVAGVSCYLEDLLSYSIDDEEYLELWEGLKALSIQGTEGLVACASLLTIETINPGYMTDIIYVMRTMEDEATIREWLYTASPEEIAAELISPRPRFIAWIDLLAARLFCLAPEMAQNPIETALVKKYATVSDKGWNDQEPTIVRLPLVCGAAGYHAILKRLKSELDDQSNAPYELKKHLQNGLDNPLPDSFPEVVENKSILLLNKIQGEHYNGPEYILEVMVTDKIVLFFCRVENLYFQSVVEEETLESKGEVHCSSQEAALSLAGSIVKEAMILQYLQK